MTDGTSKKSKFCWSKNLVKKWFNIKTKDEEFHADHLVYTHTHTDSGGGGGAADQHWSNNLSDREACAPVKRIKAGGRSSDRIPPSMFAPESSSHLTDINSYRVFVATWNVGGKSPPIHLNLDDWLHTSPPADIYVLGFQEIVPLNAGNVLGTEDNGPSKKWLDLIRRTLNSLPGCTSGVVGYHSPSPCPIVESDADFEGSTRPNASSFYHRRSFQYNTRMEDNDLLMMPMPQSRIHARLSVCERVMLDHRPSDYDPNCSDDECGTGESPVTSPLCYINGHSPSAMAMEEEERDRQREPWRYCLVASKQMVGLFLTVWVKNDIRDDVRNLKVSCVGRGLMGYLGNKGSISISMSLHQTSFCFVCSHLTSGQKEGDELRRNSDVMEILRKTRFLHGMDDDNNPETILDHDRIIWLGDLNYRIALSYRSAKALVEMQNWRSLLENDQLRIEQRQGHVFGGWNEGRINFPPTYKYLNNSDRYVGYARHPKEKRRTPAWCDRILWYGRGLHQLSYVRGESRFSDHRPVYSVFLAEVVNRCRMKKNMSCLSGRIQVEELLPYAHAYTHPNFY